MASSQNIALVAGSTGISGQALARQLAEAHWHTYGLSRSGSVKLPGVTGIEVDLLDADATRQALASVGPRFVGITAWIRRSTEADNISTNTATIRNLLNALEPAGTVRHVALMTGLKHYLGPFEAYGKTVMAETPFHESEPRLDYPNFYYAQEDVLFEAAPRMGFTWSIHRAHTIQGFATGNAMNMALTLAVYGTLCKELGLPFVFPGSEMQWNGLTDLTDADLLAEQMIWAGTHAAGRNEAFNVANGDIFRWRWMWPQLASYFQVDWEGYNGSIRTLESRMNDMGGAWQEIASRHGLVEPNIDRLASWWHSDADLGRTIEVMTDTTKSREAGFLGFRNSVRSFLDRFDQYRRARIIP
ncbi:SDR family oxidoreductase [Microbacterium sp.]|uniref:SDR family oxidoreductase n=1 Tax=Microbacterium sp. TaxID=51671 RepID=UPI003A9279E9